MFKEHEQIVLTAEVRGDEGEELKPGDVGTVIHVHAGNAAAVVSGSGKSPRIGILRCPLK